MNKEYEEGRRLTAREPESAAISQKRANNTQLAKRNLNHSYDSHSDQIKPVWICTVLLA